MLLPIVNLGAALSSLVARAKGAEDKEKIRNYLKTGLTMMILVAGALAMVMFFLGGVFVGFFGVTGEALAGGRLFFRDLSVFYVLFGSAVVLRSVLEGIGDLKYCSVMGIGSLGVRIVMSYILRPMIGGRAIAYAEGISWCVLLTVMVLRVCYQRRKGNV